MPGFTDSLGSITNPGRNTAFGAGSRDSLALEETLPSSPDCELILRLREDYAAYHARRLRQNKVDETYVTLDYTVPTPDAGREPLKAPTAYQIVEELINHIIAEIPSFTVMPRTQDESEKRLASKRTSWTNGFWHKVVLTKLLRRMLWFDAVRGAHVLRVLYDAGRWPAKPEPPVEPPEPENLADSPTQEWLDYVDAIAEYADEKEWYKEALDEWKEETEENLPIVVDVLDPYYVLWEPGDEPRQCILTWERTVDELMQRYPSTYDYLHTFQPGTRVTWCEWWDDYRYAYWIEPLGGSGSSGGGAPYWVKTPKRHKYGFFPFLIDGPWANPLQEPDKAYPSLYFAIRSFLQYESTLVTSMAHIFRKLGWPVLIVNTQDARNDSAKPKINMEPGKINYLDVEERASYLELGQGTMALTERLINGVDQYVKDATGLREVLQGQPRGKSGHQQAQIAAQARVALTPVEQSTVRTLELATRYVFKLIRLVGEKITVMAAESTRNSETALGPNDVKEVGRIVVALKTILPIDESAKIANQERLMKMGVQDPVAAARKLGIENPEESVQAAEVYRYEQQPMIQEAKALQHIQKHDPELWQIIQEQNLIEKYHAQQAQGGGKPGGGPPGQPKPSAGAAGGAREAQQARRAGQGGGSGGRLPKESGAAQETGS